MKAILKKEEKRLLAFLNASASEPTLLVCDFDGTLYRGIFPPLGRGFSAADLGVLLCFSRSPARAVRVAFSMFRLMILLARLRYRYIRGRIPMSRMDRIMVHFFVRWVMQRIPPEDIERASRRISRFTYPAARSCLKRMSHYIHGAAIVSKAFEPVLNAAADRLSPLVPGGWITHGVRVASHSPVDIDRDTSVLSRQDKQDRMHRLLDHFPCVTQVIAVGNSEDDIGLMEGARDHLNPDKIFLIAIHSRDMGIRSACNLNLRNWRALLRLLKHLPSTPDDPLPKRPFKSG